MTLPEIIYDIKRIISGGDTSVDSKFLDSHLTQVVNQARAEALSVHYMQMREKRALSEAFQDFLVLQNSKSFSKENSTTFDSHDDLDSTSGVAADSGSQVYRRLLKYSIEASKGSIYEWNKNRFDSQYGSNAGKVNLTDMCKFTLPSPVLKFGRNNGFLSFTDHSFDALKITGTNANTHVFHTAPQLGGEHVRVVYGLKELRDLQKHRASFPYKRGFRTPIDDDSKIVKSTGITDEQFAASTLSQGRNIATSFDAIMNQWISFKNPLAVVTNSDIFLHGAFTDDGISNVNEHTNSIGGGYQPDEYFQIDGQYNHQYRRKDVVMLIDTPLGKHLTNDSYIQPDKRFGSYLVSGIFANPTQLPNYNFKRSEYPIPQELLPGLKQNLIANQLMIAKQIEEDNINDGNDKNQLQRQNVQPNNQPRRQAAGRPRSRA